MNDPKKPQGPLSPDVLKGWIYDPFKETIGPPFPLVLLPQVLSDWIYERAEILGVDPAAVAMATLTALSGAISHSIVLRPKQFDDWLVRPRIWCLLVGRSSAKKTPIISEVTRMLYVLDRAEKEIRDRKVEEAKAAAQDQDKATRADDEKIPPARRTIMHDTTPEALCDRLSHQNTGILVKRDELAGWIGSMDKYNAGRGAMFDRSVWLQAYDGGPFSLDRVTHIVHIEALSASILGGIQPARFHELGNLESDGLLARFCPVLARRAGHGLDLPRDPAITTHFNELFRKLHALRRGTIFSTPAVSAIWQRLAADLNVLTDATYPSEGFGAYCGKLDGVWAALALILHCIERSGGRADWPTEELPEHTALAAERITREFLIPSGYAFYHSLNQDARREEQAIAACILRHNDRTITWRDFQRGCHAVRKKSLRQFYDSIQSFIGGGWLTGLRPGPDNTHWEVTKNLRWRFHEPFAQYTARIDEIQRRIAGREPGEGDAGEDEPQSAAAEAEPDTEAAGSDADATGSDTIGSPDDRKGGFRI
jgi:Protein of unknown function (DUF3987)